MKLSKYTFILNLDNGSYCVYNTLSNALIEIDKEIYAILTDIKYNKSEITDTCIGPELFDVLKNKKIITSNDEDDLLIYKSSVHQIRNIDDSIHITLAPTMECNFNCFYCFEQEKPKGKMSAEIMDAIVKYITTEPKPKNLHLTWFGGEPLMAIPEMEKFCDKLFTKYKGNFSSDIITTAFYLTENVVPILQRLKIKSIQVTLDGNRDTHNKIKYTTECDDVFSTVLNNIDKLSDRAPEINVVFRVNLTKDNANEYVDLSKYLINRYRGKNIGISPGIVKDRTDFASDSKGSKFFNHCEIADFVINLWNTYKLHTTFIQYPGNSCSECAIRNKRPASFDAFGNMYKCWEMIGNKKLAIGKITKDGEIEKLNYKLLNRQLYGADPLEEQQCVKCSYLPMCGGGCPIQRIENTFEGRKNDLCTHYKGRLKDFITVHLELKKLGYENY